MATLTFEEGTYTDCSIKSDAATSANTYGSGKIQKSASRTESAIFRFVRPQRHARSIPLQDVDMGSTGEDSHHILVRYTGQLFADVADACAVETISGDTNPASATWQSRDGASAWTTTGGRDDVKPESIFVGDLIAGSSGNFRGLPLGRNQVADMLTGGTTSILITPILTAVVSFRLEEIGTDTLRPDIVFKGRFATRNRENPIRSRKFGVR